MRADPSIKGDMSFVCVCICLSRLTFVCIVSCSRLMGMSVERPEHHTLKSDMQVSEIAF